jgi:hypothetical protein
MFPLNHVGFFLVVVHNHISLSSWNKSHEAIIKEQFEQWGWASMTQYLPNTYEAPGSIPSSGGKSV